MKTALYDANRLVVVALTGGHMAGWAKTHYWEKTDGAAPAGRYLGGVDVAPGHRRRGVGTVLTDARLDWIWQRSADAWYVVNVQNQASIEIHHRWNFVEVARGPRFHTTAFTGTGLLMHAQRPCTTSAADEHA